MARVQIVHARALDIHSPPRGVLSIVASKTVRSWKLYVAKPLGGFVFAKAPPQLTMHTNCMAKIQILNPSDQPTGKWRLINELRACLISNDYHTLLIAVA